MAFQYFVLNKPFGVICQFTPEGKHTTLADVYAFPRDVYSVGRLDTDSEGLLLLTNDKSLTSILLEPSRKKSKTYLAQVDGEVTKEAIRKLELGVEIKHKGKTHTTASAQVKAISEPKDLWERNPPVRVRKNIPTSWIEITIKEGKNRQVRKMCSSVGFPVLRLMRSEFHSLSLIGLQSGEVRELTSEEIVKLKL
jgi:23S rRNA pseudouridine2457 synthase